MPKRYSVAISAAEAALWAEWAKTLERIDSLMAAGASSPLLAFLARLDDSVIQGNDFRLVSLAITRYGPERFWKEELLPSWLAPFLETYRKSECRGERAWKSFGYLKVSMVLRRFHFLHTMPGRGDNIAMEGVVRRWMRNYRTELPWEGWIAQFALHIRFVWQKEWKPSLLVRGVGLTIP
jgi:hypothetical protein